MDPEAARVEHLRLIQDVVTRMGRNSFAIKGGAITISAAIVAVTLNSTYAVALGGMPLILVLWVLDGFYLRQERAFRRLYDQVRSGSPADLGADHYFSMAAEPDRNLWIRAQSTLTAMFATTVAIFYLAIMAFLGMVAGITILVV